jgi:hypothetical protein
MSSRPVRLRIINYAAAINLEFIFLLLNVTLSQGKDQGSPCGLDK